MRQIRGSMGLSGRAGATLALAVLACLAEPSIGGSCKAAKLCCQGRDSGCVIQKASPNAIIESPRDKPCYCDHACLRLNDCCPDFNQTCAVSDCAVSDWSEWTECDNKCGSGERARSRLVEQPERNGGKTCPETHQTAACQNYDGCRRRARHFQLEELSFPQSKSDASLDTNFVQKVNSGYCAVFTILKISKGCRRRRESFYEGSRVCAWCRDAKNEGAISCQLDSRSSLTGIGRWELLNSAELKHCHGKWMSGSLVDCAGSVCRSRTLLAFL